MSKGSSVRTREAAEHCSSGPTVLIRCVTDPFREAVFNVSSDAHICSRSSRAGIVFPSVARFSNRCNGNRAKMRSAVLITLFGTIHHCSLSVASPHQVCDCIDRLSNADEGCLTVKNNSRSYFARSRPNRDSRQRYHSQYADPVDGQTPLTVCVRNSPIGCWSPHGRPARRGRRALRTEKTNTTQLTVTVLLSNRIAITILADSDDRFSHPRPLY